MPASQSIIFGTMMELDASLSKLGEDLAVERVRLLGRVTRDSMLVRAARLALVSRVDNHR